MPILAIEKLFSIVGAGISNEEMIDISRGMEEAQIELLDEEGMSVHPRKVGEYAKLENMSIPQDALIKRKVWSRIIEGRTDEWLDISSTPEKYDYELKLWDIGFPYRLFKQALVGVDVINETAEKPNDLMLLKKADETVDNGGLKSALHWSFKYNPSKDEAEGKLYYQINDDSFQYEETIWESTYRRKKVTCDGSLVEDSEEQTDHRYSYPLPYLNGVRTMFKDIQFKYKRKVLEDTGWIKEPPVSRSWTETHREVSYDYDENGNRTKNVDYVTYHYKSTEWKETRRKVEKDVLEAENSGNNYNFFYFLSNNKLDTEADPYLIYEIAQVIPENSFGELLAESLNIQPDTNYASPGSDINVEDLDIPSGKFLRPLESKYPMTSKFGYRIHPIYKTKKHHNGIDIGAPRGTPIHAAAPGKVAFAGTMNGYGNIIIISHHDAGYEGFETYYAHLNSIHVKKGQSVEVGQAIGAVGSTGASTGPHLHFEVRYQHKPQDPLKFIVSQ
jgi:murein DD-endopeptidase MepM/ murein hydrolase activator NlpD